MRIFARAAVLGLLVIAASMLGQRSGHSEELRFALVIGNDEYKNAKLATPANDAGLLADALQAAGFTVTGARNLDQTTLRESFREFLGQVSAAGPDAVALVYFSGFGLQFAGENYFVPVDADIQRDVDIPLQAIRISDSMQPLAALPGRVKIVILDAARQNPFSGGAQPLASGLALVDPIPGMAVAFNAAPGTVAPEEPGPYGAYASSLTEMIAAGGLGLDDLFSRLRLRVSDLTQGAEVPWYVSQIDGPFYMTERSADAPPPPNVMPLADVRNKQIREFPNVDDAYAAALDRDTIDGYEQFLAVFPNSPYAARVAAMIAVRREEIIWRRCIVANTPPAYWSYLRRYPNGPHVWDARRRLGMLAAAFEPPPDFAYYDFGVPPPPPDELVYIDQPVVMFVGPRFAPPPRPPLFFLPPRPREFAVLPPPPPPREHFGLPVPAAAIVSAFVRPPRSVVFQPAPPGPGGPGPGGRPEFRVSLPTAVQSQGARPGAGPGPELRRGPGAGPGAPSTLAPLPTPPHAGPGGPRPPPPPPSNALVKPGVQPPQPAGPAPAAVKPGLPPPPPPPPGGQKEPATLKPAPLAPPPPPEKKLETIKPGPQPSAPPPPPEREKKLETLKPGPQPSAPPPHLSPAPVMVHPAPPPPPPHPSAAPAVVHPAPPPPPPPHPSAAPVTAHPVPPSRPAGPAPGCPPGKKQTPQGCQ